MVARLQYLRFCLFEMYVNVVVVIRCLYGTVSLNLVKKQCFIKIIYYYSVERQMFECTILKTSFTDLLNKRGRISFELIIRSEPASWQREGQIYFLSLVVKGLRTNYLSVSPYCTAASVALDKINAALLKGDLSLLLTALKSSSLGLRDVKDDNVEFYAQKLIEAREMKKVCALTVFISFRAAL